MKTDQTVVDIIAACLTQQPDAVGAIAQALGVNRAEQVSLYLDGKIKIAFSSIPALAKSLGVNADVLLRAALKQYQPDLLKLIDECFLPNELTEIERDLISAHRNLASDSNIAFIVSDAQNVFTFKVA